MYIAIATIDTGTIRYLGRSEVAAAFALDPGTCWGMGGYDTEAQSQARAKAATFRAAGYVCEYQGERVKHRYRGSTQG